LRDMALVGNSLSQLAFLVKAKDAKSRFHTLVIQAAQSQFPSLQHDVNKPLNKAMHINF
jgi:hypothetical protein